MIAFPPYTSSAGVPMTATLPPVASSTRLTATPAPVELAAIMLWPQAWPKPG